MMKVHQLMKGIREGRIVVNPKKKVEEDTYGIWKDDDDIPEKWVMGTLQARMPLEPVVDPVAAAQG